MVSPATSINFLSSSAATLGLIGNAIATGATISGMGNAATGSRIQLFGLSGSYDTFSGHTLTVTDASHTTIASLNFAGSYGGWVVATANSNTYITHS